MNTPQRHHLRRQRGCRGLRAPRLLVLAGVLTLFAASASRVGACSRVAAHLSPIPLPNTTAVSTTTSLFVADYIEPMDLTLLVDGIPVGPLSVRPVGPGAVGSETISDIPGLFWRVSFADAEAGGLKPNATYVLSAGPKEVTRFTTAAGSDATAGTPPVPRALKLWHVLYPMAYSSSCIPSSHEGFVTVDYAPATIPNTPPAAVLHTFTLTPRQEGAAQTFLYAGATPFAGRAPQGSLPIPGSWQPELDPTQEYCLTISATGDGGDARPTLTSEPLCAPVVELSTDGTTLRPSHPAPSPGSQVMGGGCAMAPGRPSFLDGLAMSLGAMALWLRRRHRTHAIDRQERSQLP